MKILRSMNENQNVSKPSHAHQTMGMGHENEWCPKAIHFQHCSALFGSIFTPSPFKCKWTSKIQFSCLLCEESHEFNIPFLVLCQPVGCRLDASKVLLWMNSFHHSMDHFNLTIIQNSFSCFCTATSGAHTKDLNLKILSLRIACLLFVCKHTIFSMTMLTDAEWSIFVVILRLLFAFAFTQHTSGSSVRGKFANRLWEIQMMHLQNLHDTNP